MSSLIRLTTSGFNDISFSHFSTAKQTFSANKSICIVVLPLFSKVPILISSPGIFKGGRKAHSCTRPRASAPNPLCKHAHLKLQQSAPVKPTSWPCSSLNTYLLFRYFLYHSLYFLPLSLACLPDGFSVCAHISGIAKARNNAANQFFCSTDLRMALVNLCM